MPKPYRMIVLYQGMHINKQHELLTLPERKPPEGTTGLLKQDASEESINLMSITQKIIQIGIGMLCGTSWECYIAGWFPY